MLPIAPLNDHSEELVDATIKAAIPVGGVFWEYLTTVRLEANFGASEYERGKIEGMREFAASLQNRVLETKGD